MKNILELLPEQQKEDWDVDEIVLGTCLIIQDYQLYYVSFIKKMKGISKSLNLSLFGVFEVISVSVIPVPICVR